MEGRSSVGTCHPAGCKPQSRTRGMALWALLTQQRAHPSRGQSRRHVWSGGRRRPCSRGQSCAGRCAHQSRPCAPAGAAFMQVWAAMCSRGHTAQSTAGGQHCAGFVWCRGSAGVGTAWRAAGAHGAHTLPTLGVRVRECRQTPAPSRECNGRCHCNIDCTGQPVRADMGHRHQPQALPVPSSGRRVLHCVEHASQQKDVWICVSQPVTRPPAPTWGRKE